MKYLSWLITFLTPFALLLLAVRLLVTPLFPQVEYRMPGFPPDEYGFTFEERIKWATLSVEYLINDADISFLGDLTFDDGAPLFNERELKHMLDVKIVVQQALTAFYILWAGLLALAVWAWRGGWKETFLRALARGGLFTVILVAVVGVLASVSFWQFFTLFHTLFFEGDTWLFRFSDTLIRLFPMRFWQDAFLYAGVVVVGSGLGLWLGLRKR
jgi:integral membrane protein (TIGR01906 family)